jgi:hypothetical protein
MLKYTEMLSNLKESMKKQADRELRARVFLGPDPRKIEILGPGPRKVKNLGPGPT